MKLIKLLFASLLFFKCLLAFPQDNIAKVYLDENLTEIDSSTYSRKCRRLLFKCLEYRTDRLVVNKILEKYRFGKLNPIEYKQVKGVISRISKLKIESDKIMVIKYYDSLLNFSSVNRRHIEHTKPKKTTSPDSSNSTKRPPHPFNVDIFNKNRRKWVKKNKKCIERNENKYNVEIIYIYKAEQNVISKYEGFNWVEDNGVLKNQFFKIMFNFHLLIIKPNGEYFLSGGHVTDKKVGKLLKNADWTEFKSDLKSSHSKHIFKGVGLFKRVDPYYHNTKHCF